MVRHVILWKLNEELSAEEKQTVKAGIKAGLEGLVGKVPGLVEVTVNIDGRLDSSNCDVMLDSTFDNAEAFLEARSIKTMQEVTHIFFDIIFKFHKMQ